jgi:hypothetical protein
MNKIDKEEMFGNLQAFLKSKGVELQEGPYTQRIRKGCGILTDSVNLGQQAFGRAKAEVDKRVEQLRQVIHEQTAPKPPASSPQPGSSSNPGRKSNRPRAAGKSSATKPGTGPSPRRAGKK